MLVLERKVGTYAVISVPPSPVERTVKVMLCGIRSDHKAAIGFDADADIVVLRNEVQERIDEANRHSTDGQAGPRVGSGASEAKGKA